MLIFIFFPTMIAISILIFFDLGFPILFFQMRAGKNGKPFKIIKFRTMKEESASTGPLLSDSLRLTKFGKFLRHTSLDELPELWNVLRGEMSLVGPRPLLISYLPLYTKAQQRRHHVRPGITGLAQINGRNSIAWVEKFHYDLQYVDNYSIWLDFKILWLTLIKVIKHEGIVPVNRNEVEPFTGSKVTKSEWPCFSEEEAERVKKTLLSNRVNYWTGSECRAFESEFSNWVGVRYAIALANGTLALELALRALNIQVGDEIIVTPRTFIASVSCIISIGAVPVFADVNLSSQNIDFQTIKAVLTKKTKAIICVHLAGWPCDMDPIMELAKQYNLFVIEDCAQAHGARYKNQSVGSIGHISAWSFCQDKIMTTGGEGGMITTNDRNLWERAWSYKDHGKSWDAVYTKEHLTEFRWVHEGFGSNYRMLELQAVIGRFQLKKMGEWHERRLHHANEIWTAARQIKGLRVPPLPIEIEHAAYKVYIFIIPELLKKSWTRDKIIKTIRESGVPCFSGSCPEVYLEKAFENTPFAPSQRLPNAKILGETSLMFLVHPTLTRQEITQTLSVLNQVMQEATLSSEADIFSLNAC